MIRVVLPTHLWRLASTSRELELQVDGNPTIEAVLDALETRYPMLKGTIREYTTRQRRPYVRFFADGQDYSLEPLSSLLPPSVASGAAPFMIIGAMAGG